MDALADINDILKKPDEEHGFTIKPRILTKFLWSEWNIGIENWAVSNGKYTTVQGRGLPRVEEASSGSARYLNPILISPLLLAQCGQKFASATHCRKSPGKRGVMGSSHTNIPSWIMLFQLQTSHQKKPCCFEQPAPQQIRQLHCFWQVQHLLLLMDEQKHLFHRSQNTVVC